MDPNGCPGPAELEAFLVGGLPGLHVTRVAEHLERCPACERALETLEPAADPLVRGLRQLKTAYGVEPVPPRLVAALRSRRPPPGAAGIWFSADHGDRRLGK